VTSGRVKCLHVNVRFKIINQMNFFHEMKFYVVLLGTTCPKLTVPKNGGIKLSQGQNVGSKASYSCLSGFAMNGNEIRVCRSNGAWTGSDPECSSKV